VTRAQHAAVQRLQFFVSESRIWRSGRGMRGSRSARSSPTAPRHLGVRPEASRFATFAASAGMTWGVDSGIHRLGSPGPREADSWADTADYAVSAS